jgi:pyridoxal phosphate enzyme (YggS family)
MSHPYQHILDQVHELLQSLPPSVTLVAAVKERTPQEVDAAIEAGIQHIGHNYVQEAEIMFPHVQRKAVWHMIGHLQRNKVNKALDLFDLVETVDSVRLAETLDRRCAELGKVLPVLIEINSGHEPNKTGVLPEDVDALVEQIAPLKHIQVQGLMTMGPRYGEPEDSRPYFQATRRVFERLKQQNMPNVSMQYLSMGMSNSYLVALQEGANVVRIGTRLFGERSSCKL